MDRLCITHRDTALKTEVSDPKNCIIWAYPWDPEEPGKFFELKGECT